MIELILIGIGSGNPAHLTGAARQAMADADLILIPFKGAEKADLAGLRQILVDEVCGPGTDVAYISMPLRDPDLPYLDGVGAWHDAIARLWSQQIAGHATARQVALLVWGDPSLYDSTLRIADRLLPKPQLHVIPGLTAVQLLTAAHGITLNTLGGEVLITTGRQLSQRGWPDRGDTVVVMLDGSCAFSKLVADGLHIWWGAYLGMRQQCLIQGPLVEVSGSIVSQRRAAKANHGWIMDTYILRKVPFS
ncbi:MAG: precorrin-6A synthase (deacetylating) [Pseudomonadota bacterium]